MDDETSISPNDPTIHVRVVIDPQWATVLQDYILGIGGSLKEISDHPDYWFSDYWEGEEESEE